MSKFIDLEGLSRFLSNLVGKIDNKYPLIKGTGSPSAVFAHPAESGAQGKASGSYCTAFGAWTSAGGTCCHAEGDGTKANGTACHVEGRGTIASGNYMHVEGKFNKEVSNALHIVGMGTSGSDRANAHMVMGNGDQYIYGIGGYNGVNETQASTLQTVISGLSTSVDTTLKKSDIILKGTGVCSVVQNSNFILAGDEAQADLIIYGGANDTTYSIEWSEQEANLIDITELYVGNTITINGIDIATITAVNETNFGTGEIQVDKTLSSTTISAESHTHFYVGINNLNTASGYASHAEGFGCKASGLGAHAEGCNATASGDYSHAEGLQTRAYGAGAHAEGSGFYGSASGHYSHTEGMHTVTYNKGEHAGGNYNTSTQTTSSFGDAGNTSFSHGIGTASDSRKNAIEIMENGDVYIIGIGGYDGTNATTSGIKSLQTVISESLSQ